MAVPGPVPQFRADRRAFLRAERSHGQPPPWTDADRLATACTQCDACITACPEAILVCDGNGFPSVDFDRGECTFCTACASACRDGVFFDPPLPPWDIRAGASEDCLSRAGVVCQSCKDACGAGAIRFALAAGRVAVPMFDLERCTGCGACVSPCPVKAITVRKPVMADAAG